LQYWIVNNYKEFSWSLALKVLFDIIQGLKKIHQKQMVHRDLHTGNILVSTNNVQDFNVYISDMGLCGEVGNIDETKIFGAMPYVAPEVLRGKPYTQAADIYSFGMIMYVIATGRQPFDNHAHNEALALDICTGIRPEINNQIAPKCYIDLIKKCWDSNPENRPNSIEIIKLIELFYISLDKNFKEKNPQHCEIEEQFIKTQEYRKAHFLESTTYEQAIYTSRLLNFYTKDLSKWDDNISNNTIEIVDFTKFVLFVYLFVCCLFAHFQLRSLITFKLFCSL
jgi:serine/threonine protein kinase